MPKNEMSAAERLNNELASKQLKEYFDKLPKPVVKPETCPYCGSTNLIHHRMPLELTAQFVFCDDCGKEWDKE